MSEDTTARLTNRTTPARSGGAGRTPLGQTTSEGHGAVTRKPTIGLALGGGGARGLAHILALEVFDEMGLKPTVIAGTSIGAIFAVAYASGYSAAEIRAHAEELLRSRFEVLRQFFLARQEPLGRVLSVLQLRSALMNAEALLDIVMPPGVAADFKDLAIPLKIVAADFHTHDQVVISAGATRPAIAASMAIPALFLPVVTDAHVLMDGGLVNPLPFDVIAGQADIIVAINVSSGGRVPEERTPPKATEALIGSLQILQNTIVREKLRSRQPDILIDVDVGRFHALEFHKLHSVLDSAAPAKEELRQKLARVLSAETLEAIEVPAETTPGALEPAKRGRLAQRLLGNKND